MHQSRLCFKFPCGYSCFATSSPLMSRWFLIGSRFARGRLTVSSSNGLQLARVWLSARSGPWPMAGAHRSRVSGSPADILIQIYVRCFKLSSRVAIGSRLIPGWFAAGAVRFGCSFVAGWPRGGLVGPAAVSPSLLCLCLKFPLDLVLLPS